MTDEAWNAGFVKALMVRLAGDAIDVVVGSDAVLEVAS